MGSGTVQRWPHGHGTRRFASGASAAQVPSGEASELVEVPLAQTGEGIAECELLRWFVAEVSAMLRTVSVCPALLLGFVLRGNG